MPEKAALIKVGWHVEEYLHGRDTEKAIVSLKALPPEYRYLFVIKLLHIAFENGEGTVALTEKLISAARGCGVVSPESFERGLLPIVKIADYLSINLNVTKTYEWLARCIAAANFDRPDTEALADKILVSERSNAQPKDALMREFDKATGLAPHPDISSANSTGNIAVSGTQQPGGTSSLVGSGHHSHPKSSQAPQSLPMVQDLESGRAELPQQVNSPPPAVTFGEENVVNEGTRSLSKNESDKAVDNLRQLKGKGEYSSRPSSLPRSVPSAERFKITEETKPDELIDYFERGAKLQNYNSILIYDRPPDQQRRGGSADVYRVATTSGTLVAVKCITMDQRFDNDKNLKRTARELEVWSKLEHDNILRLLGLAKYKNCVAMVSSWMDKGNVRNYVNSHPEIDRYCLSTQIVEAVAYLHSHVPGIVHGDIKGDNVLISPDGKPKLTDFGLTVMVGSNLILSATDKGGGTLRWMAPELMDLEGCRSKEADVYALGMTIFETLTGEVPFAEIENPYAIPYAVTVRRLAPRRPESLSTHSSHEDAFWEAMTRCWTYEAAQRANVTEVERHMIGALQQRELGARVDSKAG